jgi:hypothetical protein
MKDSVTPLPLRILVVALLSSSPVWAQTATLTPDDQHNAILRGTTYLKGRVTGLVLIDQDRAFTNAMRTSDTTIGTGFSVRIYTPTTWLQQQAADAAKEYRPFTERDITPEMLEPVLRVIVHPDMPTQLTAADMRRATSVQHVVLRDTARQMTVQPTTKEPFTETVSSAHRDAAYQGLVATFPLDAVAGLRKADKNGEFYIVVVGQVGERAFKVKTKHFRGLP